MLAVPCGAWPRSRGGRCRPDCGPCRPVCGEGVGAPLPLSVPGRCAASTPERAMTSVVPARNRPVRMESLVYDLTNDDRSLPSRVVRVTVVVVAAAPDGIEVSAFAALAVRQ